MSDEARNAADGAARRDEAEGAIGVGDEHAPSKDTPYDEETNEDDEEENETCGFCIFMKGGGCKKEFVAWSKCVDKERDEGRDFTEECKEVTLKLRECMLAHKDYYAPLLEEEEAEMEAARQAANTDSTPAVEVLPVEDGSVRGGKDD